MVVRTKPNHAGVLDFIAGWQAMDKHGDITQAFTQGYCYWFAAILHSRFPESEIVYEPSWGHFLTRISERLYDIRGDVTQLYEGAVLSPPAEWSQTRSIIGGCVLKAEDPE